MRVGRSWRWFVSWTLPGVCLALSITGAGIVTAPLALILVVLLSWRRPTPDALGGVAGIGAMVALVGALHLGYHACSTRGTKLVLGPSSDHSLSASCGGINGVPWLIIGALVVLMSIGLYLLVTGAWPHHRGTARQLGAYG